MHTSKGQTSTIRCLQPDSQVHSHDYRIGGKADDSTKGVEGGAGTVVIECVDLPSHKYSIADDDKGLCGGGTAKVLGL